MASGCLRWHVDRPMWGNTWVTREASLQSSQRTGQCSHGPPHPGQRRAHHPCTLVKKKNKASRLAFGSPAAGGAGLFGVHGPGGVAPGQS